MTDDKVLMALEQYEATFLGAETEEEKALINAMFTEIANAFDHVADRIKDYGKRLETKQV